MTSTGISLTLPFERKIKSSSDFLEHIKARGKGTKRVSNEYFESKLVLSNRGTGLRFGFTVGKKKARRSVDRVLIKRVLRESVRNKIPGFLAFLGQGELGIDVSLRLVGDYGSFSKDKTLKQVKAEMRTASDQILSALIDHLNKMNFKG